MKFSTVLVILSVFILACASGISAQQPSKPRQSPKASVMQRIGVATDITIQYGRPGVKGRKIWGDLVPYGMEPGNKYSNDKPFPWRGGANENTTIAFSKDVTIEGHPLPSGRYGMHFIPSQTTWVVIFSKNDSSWGSFKYNEAEDALRITVTPVKAPFEEWLEYGFDSLTDTSAVAYLRWEELKVPFKIEVAEKK
ncbi:MAG TPA: DUF2911 domain-containing protein [Bacteroidota bacterium]|nr:DUF2911 domain-containing protein [Bacteroidota bacterium]